MKTIEEKIFMLGLAVLDELLLHRNITKRTEITLEEESILSDFIVHVGPHGIFTFDELEIADFYQVWAEVKMYSMH